METDSFAKRLRNLRPGGETLKAVGEATGLSISYLSDLENGRVLPSLETLAKLAHHYGTTPAAMLAGTLGFVDELPGVRPELAVFAMEMEQMWRILGMHRASETGPNQDSLSHLMYFLRSEELGLDAVAQRFYSWHGNKKAREDMLYHSVRVAAYAAIIAEKMTDGLVRYLGNEATDAGNPD